MRHCLLHLLRGELKGKVVVWLPIVVLRHVGSVYAEALRVSHFLSITVALASDHWAARRASDEQERRRRGFYS